MSSNISIIRQGIIDTTSAQKNGNGWIGHCPVPGHGKGEGDKTPSLSIGTGKDGRIILKCFAGCKYDDIVAALGIQKSDLYPASSRKKPTPITVDTLAKDKKFPVEFLQELGVSNGANGVHIEYRLVDGAQTPRQRIRNALKAKKGSIWSKGQGEIVPYGLWRLEDAQQEDRIVLCEGESDSWTLWFHDIPALGVPGANMTKCLSADYFKDIAKIYAVQEPDDGGATFVRNVAKRLNNIGWDGELLIISCSPYKDPNELHKADPDGFSDRFADILKKALLSDAQSKKEKVNTVNSLSTKTSDILLQLVTEHCELIWSSDSKGYVSFDEEGCHQTWALNSRGFHNWITKVYYDKIGKPPNKEALNDVIRTIEAFCQFGKKDIPRRVDDVHLRIAEKDGNIYLDLCNDKWESVEITPAGWRILSESPVLFRRTPGMRSLPKPIKGGNISDLLHVLNIWEDDLPLVAFWLVSTLRPGKPYPILMIVSEQGSGKSTASRMLRSFVDPHNSDLRPLPENERDLAIAANSSHLLAFDNLSNLKEKIADSLCRISTGGGFASRKLYTDEEESSFSFIRPIILNGIDDITNRPDLLDRCLLVNLKTIPEEKRMDEETLWKEYDRLQPSILGAILDGIVSALKFVQSVKLERKPRMADFAIWSTASEVGLGFSDGMFTTVYEQYRDSLIQNTISNDPIASAIHKLIQLRNEWSGTATKLMNDLKTLPRDNSGDNNNSHLPKTANALVRDLKRKATFLRESGIDIEYNRTNKARTVIIKKIPKIVTHVTPVTPNNHSVESKEDMAMTANVSMSDDSVNRYQETHSIPSQEEKPEVLPIQGDTPNSDSSDDSDDPSTIVHIEDFDEERIIQGVI